MAINGGNYLKLQRKVTKSDLWILAFCCVLVIPFFYADFVIYYQKKGLIRFIFFAIYQFVAPLLIVFTLVYYLLPIFFKKKNLFLFIIIFLVILVIHAVFTRLIYGLIGGKMLAINYDTITSEMQFTVMLAAPISMILFIKQLIETQNRLLTTEKEKKEAELKLLKQQIDPHFLFNNLNILGALIQQDTTIAGEYLRRFSNLYRYLIRHKDEDIVLLEDEFEFAQDYIYLLKQRFGKAYNFEAFGKIDRDILLNRFVPPGAIQTLIENIIKHNQGEEANPLVISAKIEEEYFIIKNEVRAKLTSTTSTKTGLKNLQVRYQLLSDKALIINDLNGFFEVKIPLIKSV